MCECVQNTPEARLATVIPSKSDTVSNPGKDWGEKKHTKIQSKIDIKRQKKFVSMCHTFKYKQCALDMIIFPVCTINLFKFEYNTYHSVIASVAVRLSICMQSRVYDLSSSLRKICIEVSMRYYIRMTYSLICISCKK